MIDRSQAAKLLEQHPALVHWLRTEWERPILKYRIYWSNDKPTVSLAEHGFLPEYSLIVIRISRDLSPADQLAALIFEVCNAQTFSRIDDLVAQATSGTITRDDYIHNKSVQEHEAVLRAGSVIQSLLILPSSEVSVTSLYRHFLEAPTNFGDYDAWNRQVPNSNYLRGRRYYGEEYDRLRRKTP